MRATITTLLLFTFAVTAPAAIKEAGTTTLREVQPAGTTAKGHKHQQYDLTFVSSEGKDYTCRTAEKKSVKATEIVVGSNISYEVKGNKGKVRTATGRNLGCTIVRVADAGLPPR